MGTGGEEQPSAPGSPPPKVTSKALDISVAIFGLTDVGLVREHNEDSFLVVRLDDGSRDLAALRSHALGPRGTLFIACDGMGGAAAGEVASHLAVEHIAQALLEGTAVTPPEGMVDDEETALARKLKRAARTANLKIFGEARADLARSGMGTTMTAVLLHGASALIAQVGDSRAYLWRQGALVQMTRDQSLVNQLLESGQITVEQAKIFEHSNVILQALGVQEEVEVQLSRVELRRGDRMLVCSDGLVGVITDEEIGAVLGSVDEPEQACHILCDMAKAAGGPDNITVIVAAVAGSGLKEAGGDELPAYVAWKIEPDGPVAAEEPTPDTGPVRIQPTARLRALDFGALAAAELASMLAVTGLILGAIVTGFLVYGASVRCSVRASLPGWAIFADGRDSGERTQEGEAMLRLSPGHHVLSLKGAGAPEATQEIDVAEGESCGLRFAPSFSASRGGD